MREMAIFLKSAYMKAEIPLFLATGCGFWQLVAKNQERMYTNGYQGRSKQAQT